MADEDGIEVEQSQNREILKRIDAMANERAWSHNELARRAGLNQNKVGAWYNRGGAIRAVDALAVARAFGTTVEYVLTGENPTAPERETNSPQQAQLLEWVRGLDRDQVMMAWGVLSVSAPQAGLPPLQAASAAKKEKRVSA